MLTRIRIPEEIKQQLRQLKSECSGPPYYRTIVERLVADAKPGSLEAFSSYAASEEHTKHIRTLCRYLGFYPEGPADDVSFRDFVESANWLMKEYELAAEKHPDVRRTLVFEATDIVEMLKNAEGTDITEIDSALAA